MCLPHRVNVMKNVPIGGELVIRQEWFLDCTGHFIREIMGW